MCAGLLVHDDVVPGGYNNNNDILNSYYLSIPKPGHAKGATSIRTKITQAAVCIPTVSFHNFKSQNFKLSVSNPKSKYVAYVSVLSRISNCQGLGRQKQTLNFEN